MSVHLTDCLTSLPLPKAVYAIVGGFFLGCCAVFLAHLGVTLLPTAAIAQMAGAYFLLAAAAALPPVPRRPQCPTQTAARCLRTGR